ncbi:MAG: ABC-F family ATP-binding cassette domain-containing protein, partial [Erysipelotrichaceae bacterium]|nr:ABC-F family ATP-binding cassette domain-containing protein [Erysipelotrichaceae bacterium]
EPTNHLDIYSKEALETALEDYEGTVLFVSHDRYFIKKIANSCIVITKNGTEYYPDGYKDYIDRKPEPEETKTETKTEEPVKKAVKQKTKYNLKKIEAEIQELEDELEAKRELRFDPEYYHSAQKMQELDQLIDDVHNRIHHKMEEWEAALEEEELKKKQ